MIARLSVRTGFLALAFLTSAALPAAEIYLVRHAEKITDGSHDPRLTALGEERARNLAVMLRSAGIERIFSSDFERTRATAAPLASRLGLAVEIYDPKALESLAFKLLKLEDNALVVGHSNTTPELTELMGGDGGEPIVEAWEYDRLYLLQTDNGRVTRTILLHLPPETSPPR
jgi:phosphohistidine phosphatase SixA